MPREIERKFLVISNDWQRHATASHYLVDAVAPFGAGKVRIRLSDTKAWITFKGPRDKVTRAEFEYEIPHNDAEEMLRIFSSCSTISKRRYCVPVDGLEWSVDVHEAPNQGLVTAEIELEHEHQTLTLPVWTGPEITGLPITGSAPVFFQPA